MYALHRTDFVGTKNYSNTESKHTVAGDKSTGLQNLPRVQEHLEFSRVFW